MSLNTVHKGDDDDDDDDDDIIFSCLFDLQVSNP